MPIELFSLKKSEYAPNKMQQDVAIFDCAYAVRKIIDLTKETENKFLYPSYTSSFISYMINQNEYKRCEKLIHNRNEKVIPYEYDLEKLISQMVENKKSFDLLNVVYNGINTTDFSNTTFGMYCVSSILLNNTEIKLLDPDYYFEKQRNRVFKSASITDINKDNAEICISKNYLENLIKYLDNSCKIINYWNQRLDGENLKVFDDENNNNLRTINVKIISKKIEKIINYLNSPKKKNYYNILVSTFYYKCNLMYASLLCARPAKQNSDIIVTLDEENYLNNLHKKLNNFEKIIKILAKLSIYREKTIKNYDNLEEKFYEYIFSLIDSNLSQAEINNFNNIINDINHDLDLFIFNKVDFNEYRIEKTL